MNDRSPSIDLSTQQLTDLEKDFSNLLHPHQCHQTLELKVAQLFQKLPQDILLPKGHFSRNVAKNVNFGPTFEEEIVTKSLTNSPDTALEW